MRTNSYKCYSLNDTLFFSIVYDLIVNEVNVIINNINDLKLFNHEFKNFCLFKGFTNVEQVDKHTYKYKFGKAVLTLKEGY